MSRKVSARYYQTKNKENIQKVPRKVSKFF